jgi:hypothetical protein
MSTPSTPLPAGEIQFYNDFEPGLKDGTYRIDISQTLTAPGASITPVSQTFTVQGPRFAIDPADIHTVFPPLGATAVFEDVLPHIVLNKRLLPWERDVPQLSAQTPWMALLVLSEGEVLPPPPPVNPAANGAQTLTVEQLLGADPNMRKPQLRAATLSAADLAQSCQAITLDSALFAQLLPTARELAYLAHARQVNTGSKAPMGMKDEGWFSVVVANRFPQAGTAAEACKSLVHLVSLEGFGDLLGGNTPQAPSQPQVQLVSLASWTFSCLADPAQTFAGLAQNLAYDPTQANALRPADNLMLRLPLPQSSSTDPTVLAVRQRLADGYVALGYHAPSGEDGFAWYRGPCPAVVPNAVPGALNFETADAATIYDPKTGVFDLSLATAWQAGRSLALADAPFAQALQRLRIAANATLDNLSHPSSTDWHQQLAQCFSGGGVHAVAQASRTGALPALTPNVRRRALKALARRDTPHASPHARLHALLAQDTVQSQLQALVQSSDDAQLVANWLGQALLLRPLPFVHLVPDARMLPSESLRFFYLDPNYQSALMDGALSVGLGSSRDSAVQAALTQSLQQMAQAAALAWRAASLGQTPPAAASGPSAGLLLRSALASGWPGLSITATSKGAPVALLRLEHVGAGVMIALFNGLPDTVLLTEPQEGLEFGVNDLGEISTRSLRNLPTIVNGPTLPVFKPYQPNAASVAIRGGGLRVLNLASDPASPSVVPSQPIDLIGLLSKALNRPPDKWGAADCAVQMVKGPQQLVFSLNPPPIPT